MSLKLIALDLDDTLLHGDLSISEANRKALREAHHSGAKIVLASGRNIYSMGKYASDLGLDGPDDYLIASNGAEIIETRTGRLLAQRRMSPELCRDMAAALKEDGLPWQVYVEGKILWSTRNQWTEEDTRLTGLPNRQIEDEEALLAGGQVKFVVPGDPDRLNKILPELRARFSGRAEIFTSKPYFLEVLSAGTDKGEALKTLAQLLGVPMESILAAGDAMNDLGMLRAAGISCVPANAIREAKEIAHYVSALTNDEDFVAEIMRLFVL